ncbi:hypothetical protein ACIQ6Y_33105 [Streptomyces sp. NPDC096205]|uniref:hypothetical protein n=1 Tax=Streptomyces sp. NPDC096205 TaxID=3366081 RepID=UPI003816CDC2
MAAAHRHHHAENVRRRLRRRLAFPARQRLPPVVEDFVPAVAGCIADARRPAVVQGARDRSRQPEREVLSLCVWSGLDYQHDVPPSNVSARVSA